MRPEIPKFLHDIQTAIGLIVHFTAKKILDDYLGDSLLRSAVERQLIIVGEALYQAVQLDPDVGNTITEARKIVNFRHVIVHGYSMIEDETVWGVVQNDLPTLRREVQALLDQA